MIFNIHTKEIKDDKNKYHKMTNGNITCYFRGFFYYPGRRAGVDSINKLIDQYIQDSCIGFNELYGAYHIILIDNSNNATCFFTDNAGFCCFYYNIDKSIISDSFLEMAEASEIITPNYQAITQFIHFNCIYSNSTICNEIVRTESIDYYIYENLYIKSRDKNLLSLGNSKKYRDLHSFMKDVVYAAAGWKTADVITGGADSRTVLSHLYSLNVDVDLVISGSEQMVDVQIAREIADRMNKKLYISNEEVDEDNKDWIRELFIGTDGVTGTFSKHRLHKKNKALESLGYNLEYGGVSGELYKNSFLNQDFPFYYTGEVNKSKFYKIKVYPSYYGDKFLTERIIGQAAKMEENVINYLFDYEGGEKSKVYFRAGSRIMRYRMVALSNSNNISVPSISPFAEIDMMRLTYDKNPWELEINKWQRREVSTYCPLIADIRTDRGVTLQDANMKIYKEALLSYLYLFKVWSKRTIIKKKKEDPIERLDIYVKGRERREFIMAMDKCKELNIIKSDCIIESIPDDLADTLMTIGLTFMNFQSKKYVSL